jgi:HAE1 family hydrophobic/amphiphilic exporter-1
VSISVSLIAVLIPLLLMGGIIGRLFREFAVVLSMTIAVSAFVALTLTPMMAARLLKPHGTGHHGRLYRASEAVFDALLSSYARSLDLALRFRFITLLTFFATLALTIHLFIVIPKGFFPQQDTGFMIGVTEAGQDISFSAMKTLQEKVGAIVQADPDIATVGMSLGGNGQALNSGRMYITLKPREEREADAFQIIGRLRPKLERVEGIRTYIQATQDVRTGGRTSPS